MLLHVLKNDDSCKGEDCNTQPSVVGVLLGLRAALKVGTFQS